MTAACRPRLSAWDEARIEGEVLATGLNPKQFAGLEELARDEWPAR